MKKLCLMVMCLLLCSCVQYGGKLVYQNNGGKWELHSIEIETPAITKDEIERYEKYLNEMPQHRF